MPIEQTELAVRQHDRYECHLEAQITVVGPSADAVRLSRAAPGAGGAVPVQVVDCSRGGLGLRSAVYLPQTCRLRVRLAAPGSEAPFETTVRIQRASMTDRAPAYYLGTSFEGAGPEHEQAVAALLEAVRSAAGGARA